MRNVRVEAARGLIQEQYFWFGEERLGQRQPGHLARGQLASHLGAKFLHLQFLDNVVDMPANILQPVKPRHDSEVLLHGQ